MKFRSDEDGFITALRFYKQPSNTGTHVGHCGRPPASCSPRSSSRARRRRAGRRRRCRSRSPISRGHDLHHVLPRGQRALRASAPATSRRGMDRPPLTAPALGGNGVYRYGASALPGLDLGRHQLLGRRRRSSAPARRTRAPPRVELTSPGRRRDGRRARREGHRHVRRARRPADRQHRLVRAGRRPGGAAVPARRHLRRRDPQGDAHAAAAARATARPTRRRSRAAAPASPTSRATGSPPTATGPSARPPSARARSSRADAPAGQAVQRPAGRGRRAASAPTRTATSPRCASTSRPTTPARTSATCGPPTGSCSRRRRSATRRPPAGRRSSCPTRSPVTKDTTYVVLVLLGRRLLRVRARAASAGGVDRAADARAGADADGRQRRLPLRRAAASRTRRFNATNYWVDADVRRASSRRTPAGRR